MNIASANFEPVQFRENAWSGLVLEREYKDIVQAMVKSYLTKTFKFQDLVLGKGAGLVILLHGPPGVGKTLTAGITPSRHQISSTCAHH